MIFSPVPARGLRVSSARVNGMTFSYSRHRENVATHAHRATMVVLGVSGVFDEVYTGRIPSATCTVGTVLVRPAGEPHSNRFAAEGARDVAIEFEDGVLDRLHSSKGPLSAVGSWRDRHVAMLTRRILRELQMHDSGVSLALEALALELLAFLFRSADRSNVADSGALWLRRVREFIHDQWRHRAISLNDLVGIAGVHPVHLGRVYRNRFGETPAESIRRLRIEWVACQLLASRKPLSEIALEAGFADQSHLSRAFRAAFGTTPRTWRRLGGDSTRR